MKTTEITIFQLTNDTQTVLDFDILSDIPFSQYTFYVIFHFKISSFVLSPIAIFYHEYYGDVMMGAMASQITSLTIVYSSCLFVRRSKKTSKLRVTGLCAGNSPVTGEMTSNAENVSI